MIDYKIVPFHEVGELIAANLVNHYDDVSLKDAYGRPDVDWTTYLQQSMAGRCVAIIAKIKDKIVAYSVFIVGNNINHKSFIEATNTAMFIDKEYRGKITSQFLKKTNEFLKNYGVNEILYILLDDRLGNLLKRQKFEAKHKVWSIKYGQSS